EHEAREIAARPGPTEIALRADDQPAELVVIAALQSAEAAFDRGVGVEFAVRRREIIEELLVTPAIADVRAPIESSPWGGRYDGPCLHVEGKVRRHDSSRRRAHDNSQRQTS